VPAREDDGVSFADKLAKERRARLAAERLLDQKKTELYTANQQLSLHARSLSDQVIAQRHGLARALIDADELRGQNNRARSDLERANSAAVIAERRLWAALETFRDGFALFDRNLRLIVANGAYAGAFQGLVELRPGAPYEDLLRQVAATGMIELDGGDARIWQKQMMQRISSDRIEPCLIRLRPDCHIRLVDSRSEDGDLVSLAIDVTDSIQREEELEEARARAEGANRAKSAFLANMTHELRTPMNGVVGMAELLCDSALDNEQRLYAETIKSSGEALLTIINDVLDFSKAEASRLKLFPEPFDLERCIHEVMLLLQPAARDKGLTLLVDFDIFLPTHFIADPGRIRQILTNLIGNAVKFTASGHVLVRVVGLEADPGRYDLRVMIEDTGIGIAPDQIEHVFGEFNQVEAQANRKFEGTGLGLAITKRLVDLMEGMIWADSILGEGTSFGFSITVPCLPGEPEILDRAVTLKSALVIGEPAIDRVLLERQLQAFGIKVKVARTLTEAIEDHIGSPDIIFIDHAAEDNGPAAASDRLRQIGISCPVILLSGNATEAAGYHVILPKPVMRSMLHRLLQDISSAASAIRDRSPVSVPTAGSGRKMRVLAAEDNRTNQLVFQKMVKDFDIDLAFAGNGREAVLLWRTTQPDLIFMDISMPEMDGRDAARAIRADEIALGRTRVPIVALTAHAMEGDEQAILTAGIDRYLTKPLRKAAIAEMIDAHCPSDARPAVTKDVGAGVG
jgi:signal transduction histidine kinase/CheY-like chemotaxis protein